MKKKTIFKCNKCGYETVSWTGKCPSCDAWGSLKEVEQVEETSKGSKTLSEYKKPLLLKDVKIDNSERIVTGSKEFNRVLGGGIVRDCVVILTARPGAGKSTLFLEIVNDLSKKNIKTLYISGEESVSQIKSRANRIMEEIRDNIWIISTNSMDNALKSIQDIDPDVVFIDSIQTFTLQEYSSRAGSPIQTVECANALVQVAKNKNRPRGVFMIGHMTKNDEMAGLRTLEHLVDTVIYLEGESDEPLRVLMATKNRFGRTGEIGLFNMTEDGIKEIEDMSDFFITKRETPAPGSALSIIKEGSRMMIVEIEALVSKSFAPYPTRIGDSLRKDQLNTLISILEERGGISLFDKNVIIKVTGGIRLSEQAVNLAIIMSIISAIYNKPIEMGTVFVAEVGLTGELKRTPQIEQRLSELDRLGYKRAIISKSYDNLKEFENLKVIQCNTLKDVMEIVFR
ncbi:DNA repair protein RadA [Lagierella sp.]|uniref:DNA repair protein RadA n=1 Tax=Lagierella sp. TaxID=2849657 RepID=UPI00261F82C2|nr:DNA repair protein RadA [Lagierella sp.]